VKRINTAELDDFTHREIARLADLIELDPPAPGIALVLEPGESPRRMTHAELSTWLRASGLSPLARRVERSLVPTGHTLVLSIGDEVRLQVLPLLVGLERPAPMCAALVPPT